MFDVPEKILCKNVKKQASESILKGEGCKKVLKKQFFAKYQSIKRDFFKPISLIGLICHATFRVSWGFGLVKMLV